MIKCRFIMGVRAQSCSEPFCSAPGGFFPSSLWFLRPGVTFCRVYLFLIAQKRWQMLCNKEQGKVGLWTGAGKYHFSGKFFLIFLSIKYKLSKQVRLSHVPLKATAMTRVYHWNIIWSSQKSGFLKCMKTGLQHMKCWVVHMMWGCFVCQEHLPAPVSWRRFLKNS